MSPVGDKILFHLRHVAQQRAAHAQEPGLAHRVRVLKAWQHERFATTYQDLLRSQRYGPAARFFLDDLYGPHDFADRDAQFARIVPALVRLFPSDIVQTVLQLAELHALSEELDTEMARRTGWGESTQLCWASYASIWRETGRSVDRERQIALMLSVGEALDRFTRKPLLRHSLRLMRGPAAAAGLAELQRFLETGFDTFKAMHGAQVLLDTISQRERKLAAALFGGANGPTEG